MHSQAVTITLTSTQQHLAQILQLQQLYHISVQSPQLQQQMGFLTLQHTLPVLQQMQALQPSVIAMAEGQVVGYALSMPRQCRHLMPAFDSMFSHADALEYRQHSLHQLPYYMMGQICVHESWQGKGIFDALYRGHRQHFKPAYNYLVTEIATRNLRSMRAHLRIGFEVI
ncbi:MAG TPA: hypothetical protein PKD90_17065, partial [Phnomibacter sp.]|nr:hypothetical protein [Phnomibacter sp.]